MVKVMKREFGHLLLTEAIDGISSPTRLPSPEVPMAGMTHSTRQSGLPLPSTSRHSFMCTNCVYTCRPYMMQIVYMHTWLKGRYRALHGLVCYVRLCLCAWGCSGWWEGCVHEGVEQAEHPNSVPTHHALHCDAFVLCLMYTPFYAGTKVQDSHQT